MNNKSSGPAVANMVPCVNYRVIKKFSVLFSKWSPLVVEMRTTCKNQNLGKKLRVALKFGEY
jgi:hypothetical protein